jgi:DinB superfamily
MSANSEITTYRQLFDERYDELKQLLADLPAAALIWKPFEQSPWQGPSSTLGLIIAHTVSSTVYLLRRAEYAMGKCEWAAVDGDEGSEEFGPANHDPAYLLARVERTQAYVHQFLAALAADELDQSRAHPKRTNRLFSARYDVVHAIDHMSQHIGHGQLTRQLWALAN